MKKKYTYPIVVFLIITSCVAFGRIAGNDFILTSDDSMYINSYIKSGLNTESVKWAFVTTYYGYWNPLTLISHMLGWNIFGANPSGHHLLNLFLHIGAVLFLFLFLNKTTDNIWSAAFAAAFFALHPLRVESVAYAAERKDVLSMFFGMASLYAYAFYAEGHKFSRYFLCLALFALAVMSKPMLVTLPFVLMLLDYWPLQRWQKALETPAKSRYQIAGKLVREKFPFIVLTIVISILALGMQNKAGVIIPLDSLPFLKRMANASVSYYFYLEKTFLPVNLAIFYPYDLSLPFWKVLISTIILLSITLAVLYHIKKLPLLFTGWFWFLGTLIPVIGIIQVGELAMADRFTYLPSAGIAIMLAWGIPTLIKNETLKKIVLFPAAIFVIAILIILTWQQCGYWKNDVILWSHSLEVTKENSLAHNNLGLAFFDKGKTREAINHYNIAIGLSPAKVHGYNNRGNAHAKLGLYQNALADYSEAIRLKPDYAEAYNNRSATYLDLGLYQLSIEDAEKSIRLNPDNVFAYNNRGNACVKLGKYQQAIQDYNEAIRLKPDYANAYNNRGIIYLMQKNSKQGCGDIIKACELGSCKILELAQSHGYCRFRIISDR